MRRGTCNAFGFGTDIFVRLREDEVWWPLMQRKYAHACRNLTPGHSACIQYKVILIKREVAPRTSWYSSDKPNNCPFSLWKIKWNKNVIRPRRRFDETDTSYRRKIQKKETDSVMTSTSFYNTEFSRAQKKRERKKVQKQTIRRRPHVLRLH